MADETKEPTFTLHARDRHAPDAVRAWAVRRWFDISTGARPDEHMPTVQQALETAAAMERWRLAHEKASARGLDPEGIARAQQIG